MAGVYFTTIFCEPNTAHEHVESHICFAKFLPVLATLCMLGLTCDYWYYLLVTIFSETDKHSSNL